MTTLKAGDRVMLNRDGRTGTITRRTWENGSYVEWDDGDEAIVRHENLTREPPDDSESDGGEYAMLQGMAYGVEAYNEARGCGQGAYALDCQHCLLPMDGSHAGCNC